MNKIDELIDKYKNELDKRKKFILNNEDLGNTNMISQISYMCGLIVKLEEIIQDLEQLKEKEIK